MIGILALFGLYFLWKKKKGKSSSKVGPINPPQEDQVQSQKTTEETPLRSTSSNSGQISRQISLENETKLQAIPFCGPVSYNFISYI